MKEDWSRSKALKFDALVRKKLKLDIKKRKREEELEDVKGSWNETRSEILQMMLDSGEDKFKNDEASIWIWNRISTEVFDWNVVPENYIVYKIDDAKIYRDMKEGMCKSVPGLSITSKPILYVKKKRRREDKEF